jgi:hypothetical protein
MSLKEIMKVFRGITNNNSGVFTIEHHLKTGRYYPKYGNQYLIVNLDNGNTDVVEPYFRQYSIYYTNKADAISCIERYKNEKLLEKVETINVD